MEKPPDPTTPDENDSSAPPAEANTLNTADGAEASDDDANVIELVDVVVDDDDEENGVIDLTDAMIDRFGEGAEQPSFRIGASEGEKIPGGQEAQPPDPLFDGPRDNGEDWIDDLFEDGGDHTPPDTEAVSTLKSGGVASALSQIRADFGENLTGSDSDPQLEAALERVIEKVYGEKIEHLLVDFVEKKITEEIEKIKTLLQAETGDIP